MEFEITRVDCIFNRKHFLGTRKRVRISHGKRAIVVRVIEVLLYNNYFVISGRVRMDEWLALLTSDHDVPGPNPS